MSYCGMCAVGQHTECWREVLCRGELVPCPCPVPVPVPEPVQPVQLTFED